MRKSFHYVIQLLKIKGNYYEIPHCKINYIFLLFDRIIYLDFSIVWISNFKKILISNALSNFKESTP